MTTSLNIPKKRFSAGGLLCITAAVVIAFFAIIDIHKIGGFVLEFMYYRIWLVLKNGMDFHTIYLLDVLADASRYVISFLIELLELLGAFVLMIMGVCLTVKERSRALVIFPICQVILAVSVAFVSMAPLLINVAAQGFSLMVQMPDNIIDIVFRILFILANSNLTDIIPPICTAICWVAFAVIVLIAAGGREKPRASKWVTSSVIVTVLFGANIFAKPIATVLDVVGKILYDLISGIVRDRLNFTTSDLIDLIGWGLRIFDDSFEAIVIGLVMCVAIFFATKWISDPYVSDKN